MSLRLGFGLGLPCRGQAASAWTPASLFTASEVGGWFDPSDLSTVWQDSARTTPGAVDQPVGALDDKSGNGNHLVQATADARPILRQSGALYYLERDGADDFLASAATLTLGAGWTLAAAGSFTAGSNTSTASMLALEVSSSNYFMLGMRQSIESARSAIRGADADPAVSLTTSDGGSNSYPDAVAAVLVSRFAALSHDIRSNGTTLDTEATAWDAQALADANLAFGRESVAPVVAANLYAAVAVDRVVNAAELTRLESWLASKSGVTL